VSCLEVLVAPLFVLQHLVLSTTLQAGSGRKACSNQEFNLVPDYFPVCLFESRAWLCLCSTALLHGIASAFVFSVAFEDVCDVVLRGTLVEDNDSWVKDVVLVDKVREAHVGLLRWWFL